MQRSAGVTVSAIIIFIECVFFTTLVASFIVTMALYAPSSSVALIPYLPWDLCLISWGIVTVVGLLRLRRWARISVIVFSGLVAFFCLLDMVFIVPSVPDFLPEGAPSNVRLIAHVNNEISYGSLVALAVFWIYFFNRLSVRVQFKPNTAAPSEGTFDEHVAAIPATLPAGANPRNPVTIVILGILYIFVACLLPLNFFSRAPIFLFGHLFGFFGGGAVIITLAALSLATGLGLLKLQSWSWGTALLLQLLSVVNSLCAVFIAGGVEGYVRLLVRRELGKKAPAAFSLAVAAGMKIGFIVGFACSVAILWVLFAYKPAFQRKSAWRKAKQR